MTLIAEAARIEWTRPVADLARMVLTVTDGVVLSWLVDRDSDAAVRAAVVAWEADTPRSSKSVPLIVAM